MQDTRDCDHFRKRRIVDKTGTPNVKFFFNTNLYTFFCNTASLSFCSRGKAILMILTI